MVPYAKKYRYFSKDPVVIAMKQKYNISNCDFIFAVPLIADRKAKVSSFMCPVELAPRDKINTKLMLKSSIGAMLKIMGKNDKGKANK